jgi:hypothetical protein
MQDQEGAQRHATAAAETPRTHQPPLRYADLPACWPRTVFEPVGMRLVHDVSRTGYRVTPPEMPEAADMLHYPSPRWPVPRAQIDQAAPRALTEDFGSTFILPTWLDQQPAPRPRGSRPGSTPTTARGSHIWSEDMRASLFRGIPYPTERLEEGAEAPPRPRGPLPGSTPTTARGSHIWSAEARASLFHGVPYRTERLEKGAEAPP